MYITVKYKGENYNEIALKLFRRHFERYLSQMKDRIMIFKESGKVYYKKLPEGMSLDECEELKKAGSRKIIDDYINWVIKKKSYDHETIRAIDELIEDLIIIMCNKAGINISPGFLRRKIRSRLLKMLEIPEELRRYIEVYIKLTRGESFNTEIIKPLASNIIRKLASLVPEIKPIEEYELLRILEKELRSFIKETLSRITDRWWYECIPKDVREEAERRRQKEEYLQPWISAEQKADLIDYIDFSGYRKIILKRDNWEKVFKHVFRDKTITEAKFKELENIRNKVMHFRSLTPIEKDKLKLYVKDILKYVAIAKQRLTL